MKPEELYNADFYLCTMCTCVSLCRVSWLCRTAAGLLLYCNSAQWKVSIIILQSLALQLSESSSHCETKWKRVVQTDCHGRPVQPQCVCVTLDALCADTAMLHSVPKPKMKIVNFNF